MSHFRRSLLLKRFTNKSESSREVSPGSNVSHGPREKKGAFGLTTLYPPQGSSWDGLDLDAHIVFVHGLGGGSESTWTKDNVYWPRDLLPYEDGFKNVTTHAFGYDSDFKNSNFLNIEDFSKSLLASLQDHSHISNSSCPIVLVGHSMGGLVIKRTYIMARESSKFNALAERIRSICFVATPHQGSDHATTLSNIFRLTGGQRPYLDDLHRNSEEIKAINEKFPACSEDLILHSFYESHALTIPGIGKRLIVEKTNAILNLPNLNERAELLNGDHRSICKFSSAKDSNYIRIHEALNRTIEIISSKEKSTLQAPQVSKDDTSNAEAFLTSINDQDDDLDRLTTERIQGTCEWLQEHSAFDRWVFSDHPAILWIRGPPAAGKSVLAAYTVEELQITGKNVCYYFFVRGDTKRASLSSFLHSMARQIARFVPEVRFLLVQILQREPELATSRDYRPLWNKIWRRGILRAMANASVELFWVVDSLDECDMDSELSKLLVHIRESCSIRIFATARRGHESYPTTHKHVEALDITIEETQTDIAAYLDQQLPPSETAVRERILAKSNGCFLWATLVVRRLEDVHGSQARLRAIESEPPGIQELFTKIVRSLPNHQVSRTILTWIVCSIRPLSLGELRYVIPELSEETDDDAVREVISRNCHDLVYIDQNDFVRTRHASAREFLIYRDIRDGDLGIRIDRDMGHKMLALRCLEYLISSEMSKRSRRKMSLSKKRSPFAAYATDAFYVHLNESPAQDDDLLQKLHAFLQSENLLTWIAYSARKGNLETVLRTAQALKDFLRRKSKIDLLLGEEPVLIDSWSTDLVKLVSKFGRLLSLDPYSIYDLIPPFCPPESAPFQQFAAKPGGITVCGLSATTWDDCLCTVTPAHQSTIETKSSSSSATPGSIKRTRSSEVSSQIENLKSIASTQKLLAIGTSLGRISLFNDSTYLEERVIEHNKPVLLLRFAIQKPFLACISNRLIEIWNTETWQSELTIKIPKECMDVAFVDEDQILLAALKDNSLLAWNLVVKKKDRILDWSKRLEERYGGKFRARFPSAATFNTETDTLAIVYRAQDIVLWNYEEDIFELYNHEVGLSNGTTEPMTNVNSLVFSQSPESTFLVASYNTGDLVLFDVRSKVLKATLPRAEIYFRLCVSPDGRTFAGAANDGTIDMYDFETLRPIYRIYSEDQGITTLAFNHDSARLYDIRGDGRSCRVWEPAILLRRDLEYASVHAPSTYSQDSHESVWDRNDTAVSAVTALACHDKGLYFVGKDDATISLFEPRTGFAIAILFSHVSSISRLEYHAAANILISVDTAGYLMIHKIYQKGSEWHARREFSHHSDGTGIQHFIFNRNGTQNQILICANDKASVIAIHSGQRLGTSVRCDSEVPYVWANHPSQHHLLILAYHQKIYLYSWENLSLMCKIDGINITRDVDPDMRIRGCVSMFGGSVIVLNYSQYGPRAQQKMIGVQTSSLRADCHEIIAATEYQSVFDQVEYHIGQLRGREVFLNTDGWICSASQEDVLNGRDEVAHYFMPPSDWLRANYEHVIRVTDMGDLLFAWRGEVAVVRDGLNREHDLRSPREI